MIGLIVSNGTINNYNKLSKAFELADYVVCADGGISHIRSINKTPDIVLGDLDSVRSEDINYIKEKHIRVEKFPPVKDKTDTDLALDYLIDMECSEIYFFGATGDRIDHTFANVFLLDSLLKRNIKGVIYDDKNEIHLVDDCQELKNEENSFISVIPISERGIRVSISGCFYNLEDVHVPFASTRGISNEIVEDAANVKIHEGRAIIIKAID